jgi:pimeloyl-ACP methyl ester carboxylesterase
MIARTSIENNGRRADLFGSYLVYAGHVACGSLAVAQKEAAMLTEHTYDTGALTINYAQGPASGPLLVLLHGGSARWQSFEPILPDLTGRNHVVAPDLRGHGRSAWMPGRYRLQDYTDDIAALLSRRFTTPAALFGHSLGGMIALMLAAQHPQLVRAVVVGDSPLSRQSFCATIERSRGRLAAWRGLMRSTRSERELTEALKDVLIEWPGHQGLVPTRVALGEDAPWFSWMGASLRRNDPEMLTALIDDLDNTAAGYNMEALLPKIDCPVLIIQADRAGGSTLTEAEVAHALSLLAHPHHVRLEGVGHALFLEDKSQALHAIAAFLDSLGAVT